MGGWPKFIWASRVGSRHNGARYYSHNDMKLLPFFCAFWRGVQMGVHGAGRVTGPNELNGPIMPVIWAFVVFGSDDPPRLAEPAYRGAPSTEGATGAPMGEVAASLPPLVLTDPNRRQAADTHGQHRV